MANAKASTDSIDFTFIGVTPQFTFTQFQVDGQSLKAGNVVL